MTICFYDCLHNIHINFDKYYNQRMLRGTIEYGSKPKLIGEFNK